MFCDEYAGELAEILRKIKCPENSALSFSGGLDSSIIAYLCRNSIKSYYTIGMESSKDLDNAKKVSNNLGIDFTKIIISEKMILEGIKELKELDEKITPVEISFELPLLIVTKNAEESVICTGQGADELFGGYSKYLQAPELMKKDVEKLLTNTVPREQKIAKKYEKTLITPYLMEEMQSLASRIPEECKIHKGIRKWVLREAARQLGVPEIIVEREKKAAQYGSGTWKMIKKMAKKEGKSPDEFIKGR